MISKGKFKALVEQELVASVRVVPVPLETNWCIDAVIRMPMGPGSTTDTIAESPEGNGHSSDALYRFESIDQAASFLNSVNIRTFTVDTADAIAFVDGESKNVRYIEKSVRLWNIDEAADNVRDAV